MINSIANRWEMKSTSSFSVHERCIVGANMSMPVMCANISGCLMGRADRFYSSVNVSSSADEWLMDGLSVS